MKTDDILQLIQRQLEEYKTTLKVDEVGYVLQIGDGIARVFGLEQAMVGELLEFPGSKFGIALNLDRDSVGVAVLGDYSHIRENDQVKRTGRVFQVPVGTGLLGRVVDRWADRSMTGARLPPTSSGRLRPRPRASSTASRSTRSFTPASRRSTR